MADHSTFQTALVHPSVCVKESPEFSERATDTSALLRSAPGLLCQLKKAEYNPPPIANTASLKLAKIPFSLPPLLETADPPLFQPHIPDRDFLAKIQSANKWSFTEATFSSFLYILFEPP
ncbi:MAG: hypothetical protein L6R37_001872 [Teloschistes peruensis]|nr:MAG: hypothetical protein L6R37_001872 [Teloschistes peruensis]